MMSATFGTVPRDGAPASEDWEDVVNLFANFTVDTTVEQDFIACIGSMAGVSCVLTDDTLRVEVFLPWDETRLDQIRTIIADLDPTSVEVTPGPGGI